MVSLKSFVKMLACCIALASANNALAQNSKIKESQAQFKAFYEKKEWYRRYMVVLTFCHIVKETFKAYSHMIKKEGYYSSLFKTFKAWKFFLSFGFELGYTALPVLKRDYHPRNHPICNDEQNAIAIAWREYHVAGNNTHALTDDDMVEIGAV